ncbi:MAG TPA: hypothetical protein VGQ37_05275 [Vicinamibacterales bacterium]|nr:hypothetical protein [Vicinamibacterales bacterium]
MKCSAMTAVALVVGLCASADAQWLKDKTPGIPRDKDGKPQLDAPAPKTADGRPDLSGIWRVDPGAYLDNIASDLKPGETLPWAEALFKRRSEEFATGHPIYRCMPEPGPLTSFGIFKVLQTPFTMGILTENGAYRNILTDGRELPKDPNPTWSGYSVGRWDGDAFVVSSAGFNDQTWLDYNGHPHTEALRVTERFRRKNLGEMELQITFEDPKAYARPWTIALTAHYMADTELIEYVCGENEKSVQRFTVTEAERQRARATSAVARDVLTKYEGTYAMQRGPGPAQEYVVEVVGNELSMRAPAGGRYTLVPESPTVFYITGQRIEFFLDANGWPTHFVMTIVEGEMKAVRK